VASENKVNLVLANIPSNLLIPHVSKPFSFIPQWNKRVDNFIESLVVFANRFLFDRRVIIIIHVDDLCMLNEISSFLENYQLKVCMKWIVVNSNPQMNSEDPSSQTPPNLLYPFLFHSTFLKIED
jgi:hypothetical protein